jgi:hypothetical protein
MASAATGFSSANRRNVPKCCSIWLTRWTRRTRRRVSDWFALAELSSLVEALGRKHGSRCLPFANHNCFAVFRRGADAGKTLAEAFKLLPR